MRARLLLIVVALLLVSGCATFPDAGAREWRPQPEGEGELGGPPAIAPSEEPTPSPPPPGPPGQSAPQRPAGPCEDPDPQVVAACLGPVGAVAVLPTADAALVAERRTGRVLQVRRGEDPREIATVPVDPQTGVHGLVLSPGYAEDRLVYVFAGTPGGGQVLRIAPGETPKPVLTGLPNTPGGGLAIDADGSSLLVATGAGEGPLAGAVLRIDTLGRPAPGNPDPGSPVLARGLTDPGGVCVDHAARTVWVTDRAPGRDLLHRVVPGTLGAPAWTWPERPGVSGCTVLPGTVVVGQQAGEALFLLTPGRGGTFTGAPTAVLQGTYGAIGEVTVAPDGLLWLGTVNQDAPDPGPNDDRVIRIQPPTGGGESAI
ncbi:PQQ-dependent sugar dehydrogenase [Pseudonocardia nematodicida]|uniref:PQQ-dependent sugar dehydrogenase n=1 Tax=Pseudonocardia nematodicida TaxID=1206997 RepID=A0ABV1K378_9PSEU